MTDMAGGYTCHWLEGHGSPAELQSLGAVMSRQAPLGMVAVSEKGIAVTTRDPLAGDVLEVFSLGTRLFVATDTGERADIREIRPVTPKGRGYADRHPEMDGRVLGGHLGAVKCYTQDWGSL